MKDVFGLGTLTVTSLIKSSASKKGIEEFVNGFTNCMKIFAQVF